MKHFIMPVLLLCISRLCIAQGVLSVTYTADNIPTSFTAFDPSCNGNNIILSATLPAGDSYTVTGIDVLYNITALGNGWMVDQRSQIKCVNTNTTEATVFSGAGNSAGTFNYSRNGVTIANGTYAGGTRLDFEMHAWRVFEGTVPGCNTNINRVNNGTWNIKVYYSAQNVVPKVGVNSTNPVTTLDVSGKIKLADDVTAPQAGMIRWNSTSTDFEGYNGNRWLSLTNKDASGGWGSGFVANESQGEYGVDADTSDAFGFSVGIDGNYAIIGAWLKDIGTNFNQGRAFIFYRTGSVWNWQATLTASDGAAFDNFGNSVSIHGDYAIVGAWQKDVGTNGNQGAAYVFSRIGTTWSQQAILTSSDGASSNNFGRSVSIHGNYAIVGAYQKSVGTNTSQGSTYVFIRNGITWSQQVILTASDGAAFDHFGYSVGIHGNYAIVGAYYKNVGTNSGQGKAYIFNRTGSTWNEQAILTSSDGAASDAFGISVSINGDYAIVGADSKDIGLNVSQGKAYIFSRIGSAWSQQAMFTASDGAPYDNFGSSVSISGNYAIVGAEQKDIGANFSQGKAYIFYANGTTWIQQAMLTASDGSAGDDFGNGVGISSNNIIIGAPNKDYPLFNYLIGGAGRVYFFTKQ